MRARHLPAFLQHPIAILKRERARIKADGLREKLATALRAMLRPVTTVEKRSHGGPPVPSVPYSVQKSCSLALSLIFRYLSSAFEIEALASLSIDTNWLVSPAGRRALPMKGASIFSGNIQGLSFSENIAWLVRIGCSHFIISALKGLANAVIHGLIVFLYSSSFDSDMACTFSNDCFGYA